MNALKLPIYDVIALDIEGTVTSIQFVTDVLFPFARKNAAQFLEHHWDDPSVQEDVERFRRLASDDMACGIPGVVPVLPATEPPEKIRESVLQNLLWQMDQDRKSTALKSLQGKIWQQGYAAGVLKSALFPDVVPALQRWTARGARVVIYSSGSIDAQKLLFRYTHDGDLTPYLSGYFDTTSGPKRSATSYARIANVLGITPSNVLFCTDVSPEAEAAHDAGMATVILDRPGNYPQPAHTFPVLTDFDVIP